MKLSFEDLYFKQLYQFILDNNDLYPWIEVLPQVIGQWKIKSKNLIYYSVIKKLEHLDFNLDSQCQIEIGRFINFLRNDFSNGQNQYLKKILTELKPWRKGPYQINQITIDSEWRSDLKWQRLVQYLSLSDKRCLDVGTGNGYHLWRMLGEQAKYVIGVEPYDLFFAQFLTFYTFANNHNYQQRIKMLPLTLEDLPAKVKFDYVFSMGLLYHRRDPYQHILDLAKFLDKGGTLVLESIVVDGDINTVLVPQDRYAEMRNVYYVPSVELIKLWLVKANFINIRVVDISLTTSEEQRVTEWINDASLQDFLDPNDYNKTIEGYPAPKRAVILADK